MKFATLTLALAGAMALTGCTNLVSLNPFVTEKQAVMDPNLVGTWKSDDGDSIFVVEGGTSSYSITYTNKGDSTPFTAMLFKAGDAELLDLVSTKEAFLQVPVHAVVRVWPEGSQLRWAFLSSKWLQEQTTRELVSQPVGDTQMLTSPGEAVRSVLLKYAGDSKAWDDKPNVMTRMP
ncbi:exported hypothetical protein [Candidatus Sulfopaludibacter sp. SbA3]|nr:exported hypothetical protein [Candidatus Sulfopaludibacter sp. SbA3]